MSKEEMNTHRKRSRKSISFSISDFILFIAFLSYFQPAYYAIANGVYKFWMLSCAFVSVISVIICIYTCKLKIHYASYSALLTLVFIIFPLLNYSNTPLSTNLYLFLRGIGFISLVQYSLTKYGVRCIGVFAAAGGLMCIIHLITSFAFADVVGGMNSGAIQYNLGFTRETTQRWYFLTYDNASVFYIYPVTLAFILYGYSAKNNKIRNIGYILLIVSEFTFITQSSVTAAFATLIPIIILPLLLHKKDVRLSYVVVCVVGLMFTVLVVVILIGYSSILSRSSFDSFINSIGKDLTLSGRNRIWQRSIEYIFRHPLVANGYEDGYFVYPKIGQSHCHNLSLEILFSGGFIAYAFFILFLWGCRPLARVERIETYCCVFITSYFIISSQDWLIANPIPTVIFIFLRYLSGVKVSGSQLRKAPVRLLAIRKSQSPVVVSKSKD